MTDARRELADVLREARAVLARPDNDFSWSSWPDGVAALAGVERAVTAAAAEAKKQVPQPDEDPTAKPTNDEISQARARRRQVEWRLLDEAKAGIEKRFGVREPNR
ncbi:MAG TPA: hypothetical protein VM597_25940 [Gemmataceae bacterium]|nr:hypothetical protein [Gemmataceae bacterium]